MSDNTWFQNFSSLAPIVMDTLCVDGCASNPHASSMNESVVFGCILSMSGSRVFHIQWMITLSKL